MINIHANALGSAKFICKNLCMHITCIFFGKYAIQNFENKKAEMPYTF